MPNHFQRREALRRTATKHGLAAGDTLSTYRLCMNVRNSDATGGEVCDEWSTDHDIDHGTHVVKRYETFTLGVLADIGPRPGRNFILGVLDPELGYQPGNVYWRLHPSAVRRGDVGGAPRARDSSRDDPFAALDHMQLEHPLGDCLCPPRAQDCCSCAFARSCRVGEF